MFVVARQGSQKLQALTPEKRASIINRLADLLLDRQDDILAANSRDLELASDKSMWYILLSSKGHSVKV